MLALLILTAVAGTLTVTGHVRIRFVPDEYVIVHVMVAVPLATAVTVPLPLLPLTVAILVLEDFHAYLQPAF